MSVTVIRNLAKAADAKTIADVAKVGRYFRHPDSARIVYPTIVQQPIGTLPAGRDLRIGIVGAGAAGIAALNELSRLVNDKTGTVNVTLYESDPDSFLFDLARGLTVRGKKAGRVLAVQSDDKTVYEVGAMRFPESAGLTWQYAQRVFGPTAQVQVFPNPGKIATEFVFGHQADRYKGNYWQDPASPTRAVRDLVLSRLVGVNAPALMPIGSRTPEEVIKVLTSETSSDALLQEIDRDWKQFIADHDGTTLEGAVRAIIRADGASLPALPGLSPSDTENYYVELFARFGFGTGGFKSLFGISIVEMMRLILWDYSNEYTLPVKENVDFIRRLYTTTLAAAPSGKFSVTPIQGRVSDVFHRNNAGANAAVVTYYAPGSDKLQDQSYDYVILALPHEQLTGVVTRAGYASKPSATVTFGDQSLGLEARAFTNVLPPLLLSTTSDIPNARAASAVSMLRMVRSSKIFGTISNAELANLPKLSLPDGTSEPIKAVVSDSGLATSYIVPSSLSSDFSSVLASYTWDDDSTRLQRDFGAYPQNPPTGAGVQDANGMFTRMINRADKDIKFPGEGVYKRWWFVDILKKIQVDNRFVFDWTTNGSAGGFKLDLSGDHYQSNFCFRYHTHAQHPELDSRFFIASDSFSHLGGWLEGAFMSSVNAVAGLVLAVNNGNAASLNNEAGKVFTTLDSVVYTAPTPPPATRAADGLLYANDPIIHAFKEVFALYGPTMKTLINEQFGDGVISSTDLELTFDRQPGPDGDRIAIGLSGRYEPFGKAVTVSPRKRG